MTIKKNENEGLLHLYETSIRLKKGKLSIGELVQETFESAETLDKLHHERFFQEFCDFKGLDSTMSESIEAYIVFNRSVLSKMYGSFKVEVVAESFYDCLEDTNLETALNGRELFEVLGECSGILVFPEGYMQYAIVKDGAYFVYHSPDYSPYCRYSYTFGKVDTELFSIKEDNDYLPMLYSTLNVLLLKKVGKIETIMIAKDTMRTIRDEKVVNKMPFPIHRLDSSWFKTIVRTEGFSVRGHWRMQAVGKRWSEHRLTYIQPHQRHGYVRTAPALIARA